MMTLMVIISLIGVFTPETAGVWEPDEKMNTANVAWMITATIFVLMMTPGLSFFYGGMVGKKNVISTILQSFIAMGIISVIWVVFGFSLAFGDDIGGFVGNPATFFMFNNVGAKVNEFLAPTIPLALYALFQMKFAIITPSLITGSFAERVRFSGYMVFMILFCIFVYCPLAHWTWHPDGFLRQMGVIDFAGGIVVHASSGGSSFSRCHLPRQQKGTDTYTCKYSIRDIRSIHALARLVRIQCRLFIGSRRSCYQSFPEYKYGFSYRHAGMDILRLSPRT